MHSNARQQAQRLLTRVMMTTAAVIATVIIVMFDVTQVRLQSSLSHFISSCNPRARVQYHIIETQATSATSPRRHHQRMSFAAQLVGTVKLEWVSDVNSHTALLADLSRITKIAHIVLRFVGELNC